MPSVTPAERIRAAALEIGFDAVAMGPVTIDEDGRRLLRWVEEGRAGEMDYLVRSAATRAAPAKAFAGARSVVAVALSHDPGRASGAEPAPEGDGPRGFVARYARGRDYHKVMERLLKRLKRSVMEAGGEGARAWWAVDHTPVMDRALARNAGLGFFGKSTSLIRPGLGSYFVLGEILTNLELPADRPDAGGCGTCTRCLDICPTKAFTGPFELDARLCISYLTIEQAGPIPEDLRPALGTMVFGCDLCQEVCPWNRFARPASQADLRPREVAVEPDLVRLAGLTEGEFREAFRGMAVLRSGYRGFRRNVAVALGNSGHPAALPALRALAASGDPLVEEHARWGISRLDGFHR